MNILDILGIIAIFAIVLVIGWRATKKSQTTEEYLMADRSLSKIQAGFSMAATDMGGGAIIGATAYAYAVGISGGWYNWGAVLPLIILAYLIAKQLRSMPISSVPELLGKRYSSAARLIAVIAHLLAIGSSRAIQFTVAATAVTAITGMNYNLALFLSVAVVVAYTVGGGLLAVVNTDVFQFVIICASVLAAIPCAMGKIGGMAALKAAVPASFFDIGAEGFLVPLSLGVLYMFDYGTTQSILQRVFAAKDGSTARFSFNFTGIMYIFFGLAVAFLGIEAHALMPNLENTNLAYSLLIKDVLPHGVAGLALGGIFAATMSTADSKIMAASQLFVNDIYEPYICKDKADDKKVLKMSRLITLLVSVLGIGVCLISDSIVQMMYVSGLFYGTAVFIPMIMAIYWKRGTNQGALAAIIAAMVVGLYSEYFLYGQASGFLGAIPSNLLSTLVSIIVFVAVSLLTPPPAPEKLAAIAERKGK